VTVPADTPVTTPEEEIVAALPVTLHVPPLIGWVRVIVEPMQTLVGPLMGLDDDGTTVTTAVT